MSERETRGTSMLPERVKRALERSSKAVALRMLEEVWDAVVPPGMPNAEPMMLARIEYFREEEEEARIQRGYARLDAAQAKLMAAYKARAQAAGRA